MKKVWCIFQFQGVEGLSEDVFKQTDNEEYESEEAAIAAIERHFSWSYGRKESYIIIPKYIYTEPE